MSRLSATTIGAALLSAALVAALVPASGRASGARTLRFISVTTSHRSKDVAPKGASAGDVSTDTDLLRNAVAQLGKAKGAVAGTDKGTFTLTSKTTGKFKGTATLSGGTLLLRGVIHLTSKGYSIPVVGGTGSFADVHGSVSVTPGSNPKQSLNVYRLVAGPPRI